MKLKHWSIVFVIIAIALVFAGSYTENSLQYIRAGIFLVAAIVVVWLDKIGWDKRVNKRVSDWWKKRR